MLVDIHNHILPGLDDGAQSMEEAILLATNAVANGVTHIIATPHHLNRKYTNSSAEVKEAVANLYRELFRENIPVKILPGQEIHLTANILDELDNNLLTLANSGKYILIELPNNHIPTNTLEVFYQIQLKGYIPIIAHPERNSVLRRNKQLLYEFVSKGALIQITASSLIGVNGRSLKKYTKVLIKHNLVHFISSDAHHYLERPFLLKKAYQYITKKFSKSHVTYYCENANHVIFGTEFQPLPPICFKKKSSNMN
ncbi:tyrosine-protein phosphatase [Psychrobacillus sp. L3]|uniref:tyrosine-protein phosphatase n=1 Tax=Psychrobacillus sp. L3 TaxID=3236891 RepID=UPI0036F3A7AB